MSSTLPAVDFRPDELAQQVESALATALRASGREFILDLGPGSEAPRRGDPFRLRELIDSLFLPCVGQPGAPLRLSLTPEEDRLRLCFQGMPITPRAVELAALLGGNFCALPEGLVLDLALPVAEGDSGAEASSGALAGMRLLIADDSRTNLMVLRDMLRASGARMVLVADGEQAIEAWERERFDLLLLDIGMPVLDGLTALLRIRAMELERGLPPTPAIAVTANAGADQVAEYILAGFDDHLAKPFRRHELIDTVAALRLLS